MPSANQIVGAGSGKWEVLFAVEELGLVFDGGYSPSQS
jgi:hypothetical protein